MCSLALALTGLTTGLSVAGQYQQSRAQAAAYEAQAQAAQQQADAAYQNARIQNKKGEIMAEQYAEKQRDLDNRRKLIAGQQAAQAGASGISGSVGSPLDVYTASMEGWGQDSLNLLNDQRNDQYSNYINEVNFRNQGNSFTAQSSNLKAQASAAKQAGNLAMFGTLLGGAASMYGMKGGSSSGSTGGSVYAGPGTGSAAYLTGAPADRAFSAITSQSAGWSANNIYNMAGKSFKLRNGVGVF